MSTLANELIRKGHKVTIFSLPDTKYFLTKISPESTIIIYGEKDFPLKSWQRKWGPLRSKKGNYVTLKTSGIHKKVAKAMCDDLPSLIEKSDIEYLIIDQVQFHGRAIAEYTNRPYITLSCAHPMNLSSLLPPPTQQGKPATSLFKRVQYCLHRILFRFFVKEQALGISTKLLKKRELPPYKKLSDCDSTVLHLIPSVSECDFPQPWQQKQQVVYCGSFIPQEEQTAFAPRFPEKPLIYISLGTLQNENYPLLRLLCTVTSSLGFETVVGLGQWDEAKSLSLPGNPQLIAMAPQREILKKATICISHGGYNTFNEALFYSVPLLILPLTNDQLGVGSRVDALGIGRTLTVKNLTTEQIKRELQQLLSDDDIKKQVRHIGQLQRERGGVTRAVEEIEKGIAKTL